MRERRVGIELSSVEVRFEDLDIETSVFLGSRALPSVTNRFIDYAQASCAGRHLPAAPCRHPGICRHAGPP